MTKKELEEEIEYIHSNRTNKGLLKPIDVMEQVILEATNTYTNLSLFMNDYIKIYNHGLINGIVFYSAMNDLYLLALYILDVRGVEEDE